jgi:hypothetical protein
VKISIEGGDVYDVEPATLPNLFPRPLPSGSTLATAKPGKAVLRVESRRHGPAAPAELPDRAAGRGGCQLRRIERMWAFRRVQRLLDDGPPRRSTVDSDEVVRLLRGLLDRQRVRVVHRARERRRVPALEDRAQERRARRARRARA